MEELPQIDQGNGENPPTINIFAQTDTDSATEVQGVDHYLKKLVMSHAQTGSPTQG